MIQNLELSKVDNRMTGRHEFSFSIVTGLKERSLHTVPPHPCEPRAALDTPPQRPPSPLKVNSMDFEMFTVLYVQMLNLYQSKHFK